MARQRTKSVEDIRQQQSRIRRLAAELNGTSYRAMSGRNTTPSMYANRSQMADKVADRYVENIKNARGGTTSFGRLMWEYNNLLNSGQRREAQRLAESSLSEKAWNQQYSQSTYMKAAGGAG